MPHRDAPGDARAMLLASASEAEFQAAVIALAKQMGWLVHHVHDSRHNEWGTDAGVPDLLFVHPGHQFVWFLELKNATGRLSAGQDRWQAAIRRCTRVTASWARPEDWDAIADVLARGPAPDQGAA